MEYVKLNNNIERNCSPGFHYLASSVQIRTCVQFLHRLVGNTSQTQRSHFV